MMFKNWFLGVPGGYRLFQLLNGAEKMRRILAAEYICAPEGCRVLDIACGTADILPYLGQGVSYTGIDNSASYIAYDRKKYSRYPNASFVCEDLNGFVSHTEQAYDRILLMGVLHHITDSEVRRCLSALPALLQPGGRLLTMDGAYTGGLNCFERTLLSHDRGQFVRTLPTWEALFAQCLPGAYHVLRKDLYYLPYNLVLFEYQKPAAPEGG